MIKCLGKTKFINVVRSLFNVICLKSCFPKLWKISCITPIFKYDDSFDPNNYRGISVSSCLGELFTLIMNERLIKFLDNKKVLSDCQIGFKRNYRTPDHIFILNTVLNSYFPRGKRVYACCVDFSKAHDSVWRVGLLCKLILDRLSTKFIQLIKSMYEDLQLSIKLSDGVTPIFDSLPGVRQECNSSPLLFNLFVNDIFQELKDNSCEAIKLQQKDINCLMYADDLLILSETEAGLNNSLQKSGKYAKRWKLKISQKKTKIMVFSKQGRSTDLSLR